MGKRRKKNGWSARLAELWVVDNGICHLCYGAVPLEVRDIHPEAPSIDHVVPRAAGGTRNDGIKLAHRWCNARRNHSEMWELDDIDFEAGLKKAVKKFNKHHGGDPRPSAKEQSPASDRLHPSVPRPSPIVGMRSDGYRKLPIGYPQF